MLLPSSILALLFIQLAHQVTANEDQSSCSLSKWAKFKEKFGKRYERLAEDRQRRAIFCDNLRWIVEQNSLNLTYRLGLNHFSDLTPNEFASMMPQLEPMYHASDLSEARFSNRLAPSLLASSDKEPPAEVDWRKFPNVVGPVKSQGQCGSCWAFAAVALLESAQHRHNPNLSHVIPLSEQQLVDCDTNSSGCGGGKPHKVGDYLVSFGGLESESAYPYESGRTQRAGLCKANPALIETTSRDIGPFFMIDRNNEQLMKRFLAFQGPILVYIFSRTRSFHYYRDGVMWHPDCRDAQATTHAVLIVGYGHDDKSGLDYWIIKNSWGDDWGQEGYFYLARNQPDRGGHCLVASKPVITL